MPGHKKDNNLKLSFLVAFVKTYKCYIQEKNTMNRGNYEHYFRKRKEITLFTITFF